MIPADWERVEGVAISCDSGEVTGIYTNGKQVVVTGDPYKDPDGDTNLHHDCDAMGCNWDHVLVRLWEGETPND